MICLRVILNLMRIYNAAITDMDINVQDIAAEKTSMAALETEEVANEQIRINKRPGNG